MDASTEKPCGLHGSKQVAENEMKATAHFTVVKLPNNCSTTYCNASETKGNCHISFRRFPIFSTRQGIWKMASNPWKTCLVKFAYFEGIKGVLPGDSTLSPEFVAV